MNIIKLWGGLGNQLFQFIFGEYIKLKTGKEVFYETGWFKSQPDFLDDKSIIRFYLNFVFVGVTTK